MNNAKRNVLVWQMLLAFGAVLAAAGCLMHVSNRYASFYPDELLRFNAKALVLIFGTMLVVYGWFIRHRLGPYLHARNAGWASSDQTRCWLILTRHPAEIFKLTLALGFVAAGIYKFAERQYLLQAGLVPEETVWLWFVKGAVLNLTTTILLAAIFYGLALLILRPHVLQVQSIDVSRVSFRSFSRPLIFTFIIMLTMVIIRVVWYVTNAQLQGLPVRWQVPAAMAAAGLLGGLLLFFLIAIGYRKQVLNIAARIDGLVQEGKSRSSRKVEVTADDETGELAAALNQLQLRLSRDYAELEEELLLARRVRDRLFPAPSAAHGGMDIAFHAPEGGELDGRFYDMAEADEGRLAVIAGCVPEKGAAAVLMMTALLALFRTEARRGGTAAGMLGRLEAEWKENFPDQSAVTAALVVLDRSDDRVQVALTGGAEAMRITAEGAREAALSGSPAGVAEATWRMDAGDALQIGERQDPDKQELKALAERGIRLQISRR